MRRTGRWALTRIAMDSGADMSPRGIARQILEFLESLGLDAVTLVGNDTGGALCQFAIDEDPRRIGRVVLTNCDGLDTFPPAAFKPLFALLRNERRARFLARLMPVPRCQIRAGAQVIVPLDAPQTLATRSTRSRPGLIRK